MFSGWPGTISYCKITFNSTLTLNTVAEKSAKPSIQVIERMMQLLDVLSQHSVPATLKQLATATNGNVLRPAVRSAFSRFQPIGRARR